MQSPFQQNSGGGAGGFAPAGLKATGLPWRLVVFSGFLCGFAVFVYLGMKFGYGTYLSSRSDSVEEEIATLASRVGTSEQERLVAFYSQLVNIEKILGRHSFSYNTLPFLEGVTLPSLYYTSAQYAYEGFALDLQGKGTSVQDVVEQLAAFDTAPQVSSVTLKDMNFDGFETTFQVSIVFKKDFFEKLF